VTLSVRMEDMDQPVRGCVTVCLVAPAMYRQDSVSVLQVTQVPDAMCPVRKVIMELTADKFVLLVMKVMEYVNMRLGIVSVQLATLVSSAWSPAQQEPMEDGVVDNVTVRIVETVTMSVEHADVLVVGWDGTVPCLVLRENLDLDVFMNASVTMVLPVIL